MLSCYGCYGSYGAYPDAAACGCYCTGPYQCHGCYGCYGCYGCHGNLPAVHPLGLPMGPVPGTVPGTTPGIGPAKPEEKLPLPDKKTAAGGPARLLVELPADGKLYVDDQLIKTTSHRPEFNVPALEQGSTYYYELRVEILREGKPVSQTQRVLVKAGEQVKAVFSEQSILAAASRDSQWADAGR
jgi:uncharacterized protein (TIGR03000 family)